MSSHTSEASVEMSDENELTFCQYFRNIWSSVTTALKGMSITFRYVYAEKPVTLEYPEIKEVLPENSRSRLYNDVENCIACNQCAVACPVDCIYIASTKRDKEAPKLKTSNGTPIRLNLEQYTIDTALCCYCGLCTTVCPTQSLGHTTDFEFSAYTADALKYDYLAEDIRAWRTRIVK
jgi:NADH-quinone oxidoreductase subunit I